MVVRFRFMTGVIMIVCPVILLVFVMMIVNSFTMRMIVIVLMGMTVGMIVDVFMTMFHISVGMLMGMRMLVFMVMLVIVFVFSFHHPSSCTTGCRIISNDSMLNVLSVSQLFVNGLPDSRGILAQDPIRKQARKGLSKLAKGKTEPTISMFLGFFF
jgi:hypothetical protein